MSESILEEAQRLIHGERNKNYGHPRENFKNIADLWTAYLGWEIKPMDVGLMMVLMKVARLENGEYHRDSVTDIAGYAGTIERLQEPVEEPPMANWERELMNLPRQWDSLDDVPSDVKAVDSSGGCRWRHYDGEYATDGANDVPRWGWYWSSEHGRENGYKYDDTGPFTEILGE